MKKIEQLENENKELREVAKEVLKMHKQLDYACDKAKIRRPTKLINMAMNALKRS
jgi:hypothetical protein